MSANFFSVPEGSLLIYSRTEYNWTPITPFFFNAAQVSPGKKLAAVTASAEFFRNVLREWLMIVRFLMGPNVIFFAAGAKNIFRSCVPARYHECISKKNRLGKHLPAHRPLPEEISVGGYPRAAQHRRQPRRTPDLPH